MMRVVFGVLAFLTVLVVLACDDNGSKPADVSPGVDQGEEVTIEDQGSELPLPAGCPDPDMFCSMVPTQLQLDMSCSYPGSGYEAGCSGDWLEVHNGQVRCVADLDGGNAYWETTQPAEPQTDVGLGCIVSGGDPWRIDTVSPEGGDHCMTYFMEDSVMHANFYTQGFNGCLGSTVCDCE